MSILLAYAPLAAAQSALQLKNDDGTVRPRASDWLLEHPDAAKRFPSGVVVGIPSEEDVEAATRSALLLHLAALPARNAAALEAKTRLTRWLDQLPLTGRTVLGTTDARWLQAHQTSDPFLPIGSHVAAPARPTTVTVVQPDGRRCKVTFQVGAEAKSYLQACTAVSGAIFGDVAWIAQSDGNTSKVRLGYWNAENQDALAPGGWIWAPPSFSGWDDHMSDQLIDFLARQGPAPDRESAYSEDPPLNAALTARPLSRARSLSAIAGDWGDTGLLQTATARMAPVGDLSVSVVRTYPYTRTNFIFQPFEWLQGGFRYTSISNRLYGTAALSGSQSYKDKSVDVKVRFNEESVYLPAMALGLRDVGGTGIFSGEYLVANKRAGDFDISAGLGWGYVGSRGDLGNPLSVFGQKFNTRQQATAGAVSSGEFNLHEYFHGRTALFGGVQYQSPWEDFVVKAEYDGNNYKHEPFGAVSTQRSPINLGLTYRYSKNIDLSVGIERGNTAMLSAAFHSSLPQLGTPKSDDPARIPVFAAAPNVLPDWSKTAADIQSQTGWHVEKIQQSGNDLRVVFENVDAVYWLARTDRIVSVLHRDAPANVARFRLTYLQRGIPLADHVIYRDDWVAKQISLIPPSQRRNPVVVMPPRTQTDDVPVYTRKPDLYTGGFGASVQETVGGPDSFILYSVAATYDAQLRIDEKTWVSGELSLRLLDNYNKFKYDAASNLPRVRTYAREYLTTSRLNLPDLQLTRVGRLGSDQYFEAYAGYLETMFGGVGGEWLDRPLGSPLAFGVDANYVKQRDFNQGFGFRDYHVKTGHATLYWDTGWNDVLAKASAGQYLAGDRGVTLDLSRRFHNGVTIGAFATKTNVSASQFGEGSFDKGIYVSIPFDALLTRSTSYVGAFVWDPLTRDGGAKLGRQYPLYDLTRVRDPRLLDFTPAVP